MRKITIVIVLLITSFKLLGQVGIGTTDPNTNSILDINSANKGFLPPRVNLSATVSASPLSSHVQGMVVYNLATTADVVPGIYVNTGRFWQKLITNDKYVPQVIVAARSASTQTLPGNGGVSDLAFGTVDISDGNFASNKYTVKKAGYYEVSVILTVTPTLNLNAHIGTLKLGPASINYVSQNESTTTKSLYATRYMNVNDEIKATFQTCINCGVISFSIENAAITITKKSE